MTKSNERGEKGFYYLLFKKRYPAWIYMVIVLCAAAIVYYWIQTGTG